MNYTRSALLAAIAAVAIVTTACTPPQEESSPPPQRLLQSVMVHMTPDGTVSAVDDSVVAVHESAADATAEFTTYSPYDVVGDLPVRIQTSYRTAEGDAGTDLTELEGHTGRVEIDVAVENLTVRPRDLTYDVAGTSRVRSALIGAPLTVVGSTVLGDATSTEVITAAPDGMPVTNGVLSHSEEGEPVVQWAAVLAPPQLAPNATLSLVVDAVDFQVPTMNLSVQPGIITDPSVSGVLDAAFNDDPGSQLALERRTIATLADVNDVLTRASLDIAEVRENLTETSETLGVRSVEQLTSSIEGSTEAMESLDQQLESLGAGIDGSLRATESLVLQELAATVQTLEATLGDTSGGAPTAGLDGDGCQVTVADPRAASTVYGSLQQVVGQLRGYAAATDACKEQSVEALTRSIGPAEPTAQLCTEPSVTCSLQSSKTEVEQIMDEMVADGEDLIGSLQPVQITDTSQQFGALSDGVNRVEDATDELADYDAHADLTALLDEVEGAVEAIDDGRDDADPGIGAPDDDANDLMDRIVAQLDLIHEEAEVARTEIGEIDDPTTPIEPGESSEFTPGSMLDQNQTLADELCPLADDGWILNPGTGVDRAEIDDLRSYLVSTGCTWEDDEGEPIDPVQFDGPADWQFQLSMQDRLLDQGASWDDLIAQTDTDDDEQLLTQHVQEVRDSADEAREQIESTRAAVAAGETGLDERVAELIDSTEELQGARDELGDTLNRLAADQEEWLRDYEALVPRIRTAFADASGRANRQISDVIDPKIREVVTQAQVDSEAVGAMFDMSAAGLSNSAGQISENGTAVIDEQRQQLIAAESSARSSSSELVDQALSSMAGSISQSTSDMDAASVQLTGSLRQVLRDLGTRRVEGSGVLGAMSTSAARVGTADVQLALASGTASSYSNLRSEEVDAILFRQEQVRATLRADADLPPFRLDLASGTASTTVYSFRVGPT